MSKAKGAAPLSLAGWTVIKYAADNMSGEMNSLSRHWSAVQRMNVRLRALYDFEHLEPITKTPDVPAIYERITTTDEEGRARAGVKLELR